MTVELSRRLLALGVPSSEIEAALFLSVARGIALPRALIDRGVLTERALEEDFARSQGFAVQQVTASPELALRLPLSMCRRLGAVPVRYDATTNSAEIAAIDALDPHVASEFAFHLGLDVTVVRATMGAIEAAIRRLELGDGEGGVVRARRRTPAFPHGAPRSTAPPPPAEDVPIPLVRKVGGALVEKDRDGLVSPGEAPMTARERRAITPPSMKRYEPRLAAEATASEVTPSVSFPSVPPPANGAEAAASLPKGTADPAALSPFATGAVPARLLEAHTAYVPRAPAAPADSLLDVPDVPDWGPASDSFQAGFAGLKRSGPPSTAPAAAAPPPVLTEEPPPEPPALEEIAPESETRVYTRPGADDSLEAALDRLGAADTRDQVVDALLDAASTIATRVAVFVVKRDGYHGWACNARFGDVAALKRVAIPHAVPNILATATAAGYYLGPVPSTPGHAGLLAVMGKVGTEVAVHVAKVAGKPAMLLVAEGLDDTMRGTRALGEMMRVAGLSLGRILSLK